MSSEPWDAFFDAHYVLTYVPLQPAGRYGQVNGMSSEPWDAFFDAHYVLTYVASPA